MTDSELIAQQAEQIVTLNTLLRQRTRAWQAAQAQTRKRADTAERKLKEVTDA